jgi:hypothetical protein
MNLEEAGEIILRGEPWTTCAICQGSGKSPYRTVDAQVHGEDRDGRRLQESFTALAQCAYCHGTGKMLSAQYAEALLRIDPELSPKPEPPPVVYRPFNRIETTKAFKTVTAIQGEANAHLEGVTIIWDRTGPNPDATE